MTEWLKPRNEREGMQQWIEHFIIKHGICPPLVAASSKYRRRDGSIDWGAFSDMVPIKSYFRQSVSHSNVHGKVAKDYYNFIKDCVNNRGPLAITFILPDFLENRDYDLFMDRMKLGTKDLLNNDGKLVKKVLERAKNEKEIDTQYIDKLLADLSRAPNIPTAVVIEAIFNPVFFYGQPLKDQDTSDFPDYRGPKHRQKVLSLAPYFATQIVNPFGGREFVGNINKPAVYSRNTQFALGLNLKQFESEIVLFRHDAG